MHDAIRAYIAGILDGDGSIIFQLVRRHDYAFDFQIPRACVSLRAHMEEQVWSGSKRGWVADAFAIERAR